MSYLADQSTNQLVCEPILNPEGANQSIDPSAGAQVSVASSGDQSIDPYSSTATNQSIYPYSSTATNQSIDPYSPTATNQSTDPSSDGQSFADNQDSSSGSSTGMSAAGPGVVAMASIGSPFGFEIPPTVEDWLRGVGQESVINDMAESYESGIYSPNSIASIERGDVTPDVFDEIAQVRESGGTYAELVDEPNAILDITESHVPAIGTDPVAAASGESAYGVPEVVHFGEDHAGNYQNDPGDFADTNPQVDPEMEAQFGEGANMQQFEGAQSGFEEGVGEWSTNAAASPEELMIQSEEMMETGTALVEGSEVVEGGVMVIEAGEAFEAADLLFLLLLL
jgi:hypothetical protein